MAPRAACINNTTPCASCKNPSSRAEVRERRHEGVVTLYRCQVRGIDLLNVDRQLIRDISNFSDDNALLFTTGVTVVYFVRD